MIKTTLTAALLVLSTYTTALATTPEVCTMVAKVSTQVSELRDMGVSGGDAFRLLLASGVPEDAAYAMVLVVYTQLKDTPPDEVGNMYYKVCLGGVT